MPSLTETSTYQLNLSDKERETLEHFLSRFTDDDDGGGLLRRKLLNDNLTSGGCTPVSDAAWEILDEIYYVL